MKFKNILVLYLILSVLLLVFSYFFVDVNFPWQPPEFFQSLAFRQRQPVAMIFLVLVLSLFTSYGLVLSSIKLKKLSGKNVWQLIILTAVILLLSWPALSYDIFNYMATAKVTFFYHENPYLVMPIEFVGEPMLDFMHAANKFALYPPFWILLTAIPYFLSLGEILWGIFVFKAWVIIFYFGVCWLVWKMSDKNPFSLSFFALNPLVIIETLVSAHNDVVMMLFALLAFYWLLKGRPESHRKPVQVFSWGGGAKKALSLFFLFLSVAIKYATIILLPLWFFAKKMKKDRLLNLAAILMGIVFLLSPLREEIYSWYFIWVLALASLLPQKRWLLWLSMGFSFSLLLRYLPFLLTRTYGGSTPLMKEVLTFCPIVLVLMLLIVGLPRHLRFLD